MYACLHVFRASQCLQEVLDSYIILETVEAFVWLTVTYVYMYVHYRQYLYMYMYYICACMLRYYVYCNERVILYTR